MEKLLRKVSILFSVLFRFGLVLILFGFCLVMLPMAAKAATLYLEPSQATYSVGQTFIEEVRINLDGGENINVVEVNLRYPIDILEVKDISFGNSIFTIIPQKPLIDNKNGLISFAGGILGGYAGKISGDPGLSNLLAKIIFRASPRQSARIFFQENSQVLLNDGLGTPTKLTLKSAIINTSEVGLPKDEWQEELEKDTIPSEPFEIKIQKNPEIFDGKYFIIFSTSDKQTGIDRYEISETKNKDQENWQRGESPYLLTDQSLKSFIKVKAIDKAGNERIETLMPQPKKELLIPISLLTLMAIIIFYFWFKKLLRSKK